MTIIRKGKDVESGTLSDLRHLTRTSITAETEESPQRLADMQGVHRFQLENGQVHFDVDTDRLDAIIREVAALGVRNLVSRPPTLEQLFMRHYGEELSDAERVPQGEHAA